MTTPRKLGEAGRYARVNGQSTQQTVSSVPAVLQRIVVSNSAPAVGTITLGDGANTLGVWTIPASTTVPIEIGVACLTSVLCTPSATTLDILFVLD